MATKGGPGAKARLVRLARRLLVGGVLAGLTLALGLGVVAWRHPLGKADLERLLAAKQGTLVLDCDGRPLRLFLGRDDTALLPVPLAAMDPRLLQATIAVEDERFYHHPGVDPLAVGRAMGQNLLHGRVVSGASTLTMQVARQVARRPRTWPAKVIESVQALQLEWALPKDQILCYYLNLAPYGGNVLGVEAAARRYFGKPAAQLSLAEAALLAGLPQSPARLRPDRNPAAAVARRNHVLARMLVCGFIDAATCRRASAEPLVVAPAAAPARAPHFAAVVHANVAASGLVTSTLDARVQAVAERALAEQLAHLPGTGVSAGAVVVIDPRTAALVALACAPAFTDTAAHGQVDGALALRSPGSALKPFIYLAALDDGLITPARSLPDVPLSYHGYAPLDYDREFLGPLPAGEALARSRNAPAVWLLQQAGTRRVSSLLRHAGLTTLAARTQEQGLALALGGAGVRLLELTNAYATLARLGEYRPLRLLAAAPLGDARQVASPGAAYLLAEMLADTERQGGQALWRTPANQVRMAWKTGTSFGNRDAWAFAYTPNWTVGVWLGRHDGRPATLSGLETAAPVAAAVLEQISGPARAEWFARPAEVQRRAICSLSGMPAGPDCPQQGEDWCLSERSDPTPCDVHQRLAADGHAGTAARVVEHWPPVIAAWLRQQGGVKLENMDRMDPMDAGNRGLTAVAAAASSPSSIPSIPSISSISPFAAAPRIISPTDGNTYAAVSATPGALPQLRLEARSDGGVLYWFIDGELVAHTAATAPAFWPATRGAHLVSCVTPAGRASQVRIHVE